jgi:cobalt-zinc-cadmium efflux system membrane fusion protein
MSTSTITTRHHFSVRKAIPTIAIAGLLAGLAYWGHASDWTLPKFSALTGGGGATGNQCQPGEEGWCKEHNVPEAECIECNAKLIEPQTDYGWCPEHGISQCPLHHPEVAQLKTIPTVSEADIERANKSLALLPRPENGSRCKHYQRRIQFASVEAIDKAGIDIAVAQESPILEAISANGEVLYDQTHLARLTSRVVGTVWRVEKQVGAAVRKSDILALVDSAQVGRSKSDFLQAISQLRLAETNFERLQPLARDGAVAGKLVREAEAALQEAQIKLLGAQQALVNLGLPVAADEFSSLNTQQIAQQIQFLGLPAALTAEFEKDATTSNLLPLRSPLDGVVVDCKVVAGETVDANAAIFSVADLRRMWLVLDVRQEDVGQLSLGQSVLFKPTNGKTGQETKGAIAWISTAADDKTRTVKVRVELPNTDGRLRANTFGSGRIVLREESRAIVIPTEAVHTDGDCHIVFVRDKDFLREGAPKFFHVREVRLGVRDGDSTEIIVGLLPGEVIASKNSMVLEAQLLKSNLGEGCACCAPAKK